MQEVPPKMENLMVARKVVTISLIGYSLLTGLFWFAAMYASACEVPVEMIAPIAAIAVVGAVLLPKVAGVLFVTAIAIELTLVFLNYRQSRQLQHQVLLARILFELPTGPPLVGH